MVKDGEFSATNIAGILSSAGINLGLAIALFIKHANILNKFVRNGEFAASNISNMLRGAGANISRSI